MLLCFRYEGYSRELDRLGFCFLEFGVVGGIWSISFLGLDICFSFSKRGCFVFWFFCFVVKLVSVRRFRIKWVLRYDLLFFLLLLLWIESYFGFRRRVSCFVFSERCVGRSRFFRGGGVEGCLSLVVLIRGLGRGEEFFNFGFSVIFVFGRVF